MKKTYRIGFDLGGTKMLSVVFGSDYKVIGKAKKKTKGHKGGEAGMARMVATIEDALQDAGVEARELAGIGIAAPGPLNTEKGILENPTNLRWGIVKITEIMEKQFGCPVCLANDVDAGTFGEYRFGAGGNKCRSLLGVFPGTGIGGGFVYRGKLLTGGEAPCLEIGHIQVLKDGVLCGCGQRGCLETVASRLAISAELAMAAYRGDAPSLFEQAGTDISKMRSSVIAEAIEKGDKIVRQIVENSVRWLGIGIAGACNLLAPEIIVLGGGMVEAMPDLYKDTVTKVLRKRVFPSFVDRQEVKIAQCGDHSSALGAAALLDDYLE